MQAWQLWDEWLKATYVDLQKHSCLESSFNHHTFNGQKNNWTVNHVGEGPEKHGVEQTDRPCVQLKEEELGYGRATFVQVGDGSQYDQQHEEKEESEPKEEIEVHQL